ncbi:chitin disaccharide deacetylase [Enterococcus sp. AZ146]
MGKVIFNSDDFGYSHGVNYGIMDAYQRGILTSTTLMANMPGFEHAVKLRKEMPRLGVGVHLTLTCGKPLLKTVDTLIESGEFRSLSYYQHPLTLTKINCIRNGMLRFKKFIMWGSYQLI